MANQKSSADCVKFSRNPLFLWQLPCTSWCMDFPSLVQRVRSEFSEMPGLRLTPAQAGRLLGLDPASCQKVLNVLVQSAFLRWTADGTVVLRSES
jgi:hypothetical protein